ncbi:MAG TPA: desulfoferrodoxin family protein [bacterium]|nr:desulfoferrodoxin family protein [bacterium]
MLNIFQSADWKKEKHVPVIEIIEKNKEKGICLKVSVGKEIPHPNTTSHHIVWIEVYFLPDGSKFPYQIGKVDFLSHGASTEGPDTSSIYTEPILQMKFKTAKEGKILSFSYCNIHGLWENEVELKF